MKYYFSLFVFLGFINLAFAQDTTKTDQKELSQGLEFQIGSLLYLTNFDGYTFSYRYLFNNNSGIRIGIYASINKDDNDITQQVDSVSIKPPTYSHDYDFKFSVQYLGSLMRYKSFSLIAGGGPFISYSKRDNKYYNLGTTYSSKYDEKTETTAYGLDLILGVEYKLFENVILSGEYDIALAKESSDIEFIGSDIYNDPTQNRIRKQSGTENGFSVNGTGVNMGISIFF